MNQTGTDRSEIRFLVPLGVRQENARTELALLKSFYLAAAVRVSVDACAISRSI